MRGVLFIALAVMVAAGAPARADGTLDVAPGAASAAADATSRSLEFLVYGFYGQPATDGHHYKLAYEDGARTWVLYQDADGDYRVDDGERLADVPVLPADVHGSGTDHVLVLVPSASLRAQVCTADAGSLEAAATGLRCGGDMDGDGATDTHEIVTLRNPFRPSDDGSDALVPSSGMVLP